MHSYQEALEAFEKCTLMAPDTAQFHADHGRALASLERMDEAVVAFDKALELDKRDGQTWKYKGTALLKLGRYEDAVGCFNRAIDYLGDDAAVYKSKGRALEELGRVPDALEAYLKALSLDDSDAQLWARAAGAYSGIGDVDNAASAIERSLKIDPRNQKAWMVRASLMEKMGKEEEALKCYDSAIGIDPQDPFAWNGKGMILLNFGSYDLAKRAFDKALEINPSMESPAEGRRIADRKLHEADVVACAMKVLEAEYRSGAEVTKEDAFRECQIPYSALDEVFDYLAAPEPVDVNAMSPSEFAEYEDMSRRVLLAAYRNPSVARHGLRLADVMMNLPEKDVVVAKKVHAYIERVNEMEFKTVAPDEETERMLRAALQLPEEKRSTVGLMESLGIGLYRARKLTTMVQSFKGTGRRGKQVRVKELEVEQEPVGLEEEPEGVTKDLVERATERGARAEPRARKPSPYDAPELYVKPHRAKKPEAQAEEAAAMPDLKGRRCLFHGGLAVTKCGSCGAVLCSECTSSGACPRCKSALGTGPAPRKARAEGDNDAAGEEESPESRDWSRL
jgi:tetratricopeptide (TPR) repeat protein